MITPSHKAQPAMSLRQRGLTMMELLITIGTLALLMAGLAQLVVTNSLNANATGTLARIADTGRVTIQLLSADIRRAGYLGGNINLVNSAGSIGGTLGASSYTKDCNAATTEWARMLDQHLLGIDAPDDASDIPYDCILGEWLRGDALTVRYAATPAVSIAEMEADKPYLRTTVAEGRLFLGADTNESANELSDTSARTYSLAAYTYFVGSTGRTCQDREIPALFRTTIGANGLPVTQELLAGVENMQFRYLVDNRYYDANEVPLEADAVTWQPVAAVEMTVLVRAECPEAGFNIDRTFDLAGTAYDPVDKDFRRQVFTTTAQLRN